MEEKIKLIPVSTLAEDLLIERVSECFIEEL